MTWREPPIDSPIPLHSLHHPQVAVIIQELKRAKGERDPPLERERRRGEQVDAENRGGLDAGAAYLDVDAAALRLVAEEHALLQAVVRSEPIEYRWTTQPVGRDVLDHIVNRACVSVNLLTDPEPKQKYDGDI